MTWLSPAAWWGLGLLALPVLVHLFSRRPARTVAFPSLRFLAASPLKPTRRSHVSDWPLLLVRLALVAAAVAALAQPLRTAALRARDPDGARVVLLDASLDASLDTLVAAEPSTASASDGRIATATRIVRASDLGAGLARAVAALRLERPPRALDVIVPRDLALDDSMLFASVPRDVALRVHTAARRAVPVRTDTIGWVTNLEASRAAAVVEATSAMGGPPVRVLAPGSASALPVLVQGGGMATAGRSAAGATRPDSLRAAESARVLARVAHDAAIAEVARALTTDSAAPSAPGNIVIARRIAGRAAGAPVIVAQRRGDQLVFVTAEDQPASALALLLAAGGTRAAADSNAPPTVDAPMLARWRTLPAGAPIGDGTVPCDVHALPTDARWLWMLVLGLLGLEWWMRRAPRTRGEPAPAVRA